MSFLVKLLIFFGWMLIFPEGIVDSASMKQSDEQIYPYPYHKVSKKIKTYFVSFISRIYIVYIFLSRKTKTTIFFLIFA